MFCAMGGVRGKREAVADRATAANEGVGVDATRTTPRTVVAIPE